MGSPIPPVGGCFRPDGLFLTVIEDGKTYQRLISWNELYKMAKRGEKMTAKGMLKKVTDQISRAVKSNQDFTTESQKRLDELKKMTQERPVLPPKAAF